MNSKKPIETKKTAATRSLHRTAIQEDATGTRSIRRALDVLSFVAGQQAEGVRFTDVSEVCGLGRSTAHRILACLQEEGYLERDDAHRRYRLGLSALILGSAALNTSPLVESCRIDMKRLARLSGDSVFLLLRQGDFAQCLHREEGSFYIKVLTTNVGQRRLLGPGAGGLAMLATLPDAEIDAIYARHEKEYESLNFPKEKIHRLIEQTRKNGYSCLLDEITLGAGAVSVAFKLSENISAAMTISTITPRLREDRQQELIGMLRETVRSH